MITRDELKINTIYIISKGRPQCLTAKALEKIHYPGKYFIVCGNNDETLPEYYRNWGDKVIVFDWYEEIKTTETLDNFGFEKKGSGACPVRNAVRKISWDRGEIRHWQFDDDFTGFNRYDGSTGKNKTIKDGKILFSTMYRIAEFAYKADLCNISFMSSTIKTAPSQRFIPDWRSVMTHNQSSDPEKWVKWTGRGCDDLIHSFDVMNQGRVELSVRYLQLSMDMGAGANTDKNTGGLEMFRNNDGTIRRSAYEYLVMPGIVKLKYRKGMYGNTTKWSYIRPRLIHEKWRKEQ